MAIKKTMLRPINSGHNIMPEIRPSVAIESRYYRTLMDIINDIRNEVDAALVREYKAELANDGISDWLAHAVDYLLDKWNKKLGTLSQDVAKEFVDKTVSNYDVRFAHLLRQRGFTVRMQNNEQTLDALRGAMGENVGLIRSIGTEYLSKVETHVWQSVTGGYDLKALTDNLQHDFHVTRNRAELIARDQSAKAHAVIERSRRQELGITKAIWIHSHAGKQPRPSHLAAHGKEFDVEKGLFLDGEWVLPGQAINCRCGSKAILPF
ncbi:phage head morphogenesis protein [Xenorhabdus bovienii]|uniref:Phage head morphogenesis protein n=1 Tax=Xenorhabdus bovienii TaxID=40576 RepID=A0AAJ1N6A5_XENBV|nr:phage minor head protein [Xenorhabdus bovienii]MDE1479966.1 phage head morphogenesis protein [Xenorhabdus bovienii]MDE9511663.1 phage head morphogenesis protein [Xenorhabdus bovienii]MDE9523305.1 phage head morphogenesis protein [Xenorhabdus bovienii]